MQFSLMKSTIPLAYCTIAPGRWFSWPNIHTIPRMGENEAAEIGDRRPIGVVQDVHHVGAADAWRIVQSSIREPAGLQVHNPLPGPKCHVGITANAKPARARGFRTPFQTSTKALICGLSGSPALFGPRWGRAGAGLRQSMPNGSDHVRFEDYDALPVRHELEPLQ